MNGTVVISAVHAVTYVVLSETEKHVPYEELVGTAGCMTLQPGFHTNRGRYNRIEIYFKYDGN